MAAKVTRDVINNKYFEWMYDMMCAHRFAKGISFRKLLMRLHSIDFTYSNRKDAARSDDGMDLRYRFAYRHVGIENAERYLSGPCSVLEMIVALAIRCEETMNDTKYGDRTSQWFWGMITNLGLGGMEDTMFDRRYVDEVVERFLNRDYEPNGRGGLFTIRNCDKDLRTVEIWYQMWWYLDTIT